jgi:hypothetical protein
MVIYFYLLIVSLTLPQALIAAEKFFSNDVQALHAPLQEILHSKVSELIEHSENVPSLKEDIGNAWKKLTREGVLEVTGTDKEVRPVFVALQGIIEHVLSTELQHHIKTLNGYIHTPMPATPLCTRGAISSELVNPSIEMDPQRLLTVKARVTIIRDYLFQGRNLYIIYPRSGLLQRTAEQQQIYREELANYPSHLFDVALDVESIPLHLIGATYFFTDQSDNLFMFGIKITQANNPLDSGNFGLWFGAVEEPAIKERIRSIAQFLEANGFYFFQYIDNLSFEGKPL